MNLIHRYIMSSLFGSHSDVRYSCETAAFRTWKTPEKLALTLQCSMTWERMRPWRIRLLYRFDESNVATNPASRRHMNKTCLPSLFCSSLPLLVSLHAAGQLCWQAACCWPALLAGSNFYQTTESIPSLFPSWFHSSLPPPPCLPSLSPFMLLASSAGRQLLLPTNSISLPDSALGCRCRLL